MTVLTSMFCAVTDTVLTTSCRVMISCVVALHFPVQLHPVRRSVLALLSRNAHRRAQHVTAHQYNLWYYAVTVSVRSAELFVTSSLRAFKGRALAAESVSGAGLH